MIAFIIRICLHLSTLYTYTIHICQNLVHLESSGPPSVLFQPLGSPWSENPTCSVSQCVCAYTLTYTHKHSHPRQKIEKIQTSHLFSPMSKIMSHASSRCRVKLSLLTVVPQREWVSTPRIWIVSSNIRVLAKISKSACRCAYPTSQAPPALRALCRGWFSACMRGVVGTSASAWHLTRNLRSVPCVLFFSVWAVWGRLQASVHDYFWKTAFTQLLLPPSHVGLPAAHLELQAGLQRLMWWYSAAFLRVLCPITLQNYVARKTWHMWPLCLVWQLSAGAASKKREWDSTPKDLAVRGAAHN